MAPNHHGMPAQAGQRQPHPTAPDQDAAQTGEQAQQRTQRRHVGRRIALLVLIVLVVGLIVARLAAPAIIHDRLEQAMNADEDYSGTIGAVGLSVLGGSLTLSDVEIRQSRKTDAETENVDKAAATIPELVFDWKWSDLIFGEVVADLHLDRPRAMVITDIDEDEDSEGEQVERPLPTGGVDIVLTDAVPFTFQDITVDSGTIRLLRTESEPKIDLALTSVAIKLQGISNQPQRRTDDGAKYPSTLAIEATTPGSGSLTLDGSFDLTDGPLKLDLDADLNGLPITAINDVLEAYANIDAEAGMVHMSGEFLFDEVRYDGYVKVFIDGLDVLRWGEEEGDGVIDKVWDAIVGTTAEILENQGKDTQAARIPISGNVRDANKDMTTVLTTILSHAFVRALLPGVEGKLDWIDSVSASGKEGPIEEE